jgi:protein-disulfide isomerase
VLRHGQYPKLAGRVRRRIDQEPHVKIFPNEFSLNRRSTLALAIAASAALGAAAQPLMARPGDGPSEVAVEALMNQPELPDLAMGNADAKVTIVEYASMTCGHCKQFHTNVLPDLKTKYVDTGKVRLVFREFPLDPRAFAASMLARCAGGDKTLPLIGALFEKQADWAHVKENPTPKLFEIAKQAGFTQESFDKCLTDQALLDKLTAIRTRAAETFGVSATPTFYVNGKKLTDPPTLEGFDKTLEPLLK